MKKLNLLSKSIFAALVLGAMFSPAVIASTLIGTYCVEINSFTRPFELATSEIGEGHYLLNGTHTDPSSSNIGAVIGSASIADGAITMTLRASRLNCSAMSISTYQFDLALNNLSGVFQSMTQDSSGSILHDNGVAALVDCSTPMVGSNEFDDDGDGFTENMGDCDDSDSSRNPDAFEICGDGIDQDCSGTDAVCPAGNGTVTSLTGRVWMDRNLGASQVATAYNDPAAYGDLYQWGRGTDGHEKRTSSTTTNLSSSDTPGHGSFILASSSPYNWRSPQNDSLWQGVSGVNNPCPSGFRLPTETEWEAERLTWSTNNGAGAFSSPLKLVSAGYRLTFYGSFYNAGSTGSYSSSSVNGRYALHLDFSSVDASVDGGSRANGFSVRCIED